MKYPGKSYLFVCVATLLWASTAAVVKLNLKHLNSMQLLLCSSLIATIFLYALVLFQRKQSIIMHLSRRDYIRFAYMGFLGVFAYYALLYAAIQTSPAQQAFIINYTWPIWVVIFSALLLQQKVTYKTLFAILLSFFGVYVVATAGNLSSFSFHYLKGDLLAIAGAICYGLFSALATKHNYDRVVSTAFYYGFAFLYTCLFTLLFGALPEINSGNIAGLLWIGIFTSGLAFVMWLSALKHGKTAAMSNFVFLTPFLSLIYSRILVGEHIRIASVVGCAFIVLGILLQSVRKIRPRRAEISL